MLTDRQTDGYNSKDRQRETDRQRNGSFFMSVVFSSISRLRVLIIDDQGRCCAKCRAKIHQTLQEFTH